jgi:hypothetical protein
VEAAALVEALAAVEAEAAAEEAAALVDAASVVEAAAEEVVVLEAQAARPRTITTASRIAMSFFILVFLSQISFFI